MPFSYAERMQSVKASAIREILKVTQAPDILSFAGGLPEPALFPVDAVKEATQKILDRDSHRVLQYSPTEGWPALKTYIAEHYGVTPDCILPVSGSQQGLDLIARSLLDPGDEVIVERPGYLGALQIFQGYQAQLTEVTLDDDGPDLTALEAAFQRGRAKLFYTIPNFQNPTGITMSLARRRQVIELARRYGVVIVEDDPYGQIRFAGESQPSLWSLAGGCAADPDLAIVHLGSFSKIVVPGFRVGWVLGPASFISRLVLLKQTTDLHTGTFVQALLAEMMTGFDFPAHLASLRKTYGSRASSMLASLHRHLDGVAQWTKPQGGMFIWVRLPAGIDTATLLPLAVAEAKVAYVPGAPFYASNPELNCLRLNFSNVPEASIEAGMERLCRLLRKAALGKLAS
ncbi:aminotransferase class I/II-fold pyridoxal phosphate-dependent enzyme [Heliobacterium gestii]|uniref:Aminotransferase class I/II-fold pyridoxal phosphate-dependent enzyme n=1 Tax=Heliomicrobium gestii TaxID=2699 RepID=A0A845L997_HELGE|nr:PLP-dependent aminotransferase family protein [Heliomicrobium gestii]MBM7867871.1 2-aminoadipate transaminase [Heliomicrobium gestii]MZP43317.1 aminotransferase class I/II-fold pyridoxal phosphate-dependent enzyme [Heliomicrobium gestii]